MFAVVSIAGKQVKVSPADKIYVPKLAKNIGDSVSFNTVHLLADENRVQIGNPYLKDISVNAKILSHEKDDKVIVFKKKRRKGYRVRRGHRQQYTQIEITSIS